MKRIGRTVLERTILGSGGGELSCAENFSAASQVELSSCCKNRQEELGRGRTV